MNDKSQVFNKLEHFITQEMRMSHIYQPFMIMGVLKNSGRTDVLNAGFMLSGRHDCDSRFLLTTEKDTIHETP